MEGLWARWGREAAGNEGHVGEAGPAMQGELWGPKFAHQESDGDRLKLPPMTKQRAIPTHHYRQAGISKQGFGGVAGEDACQSPRPRAPIRNMTAISGCARDDRRRPAVHPAQRAMLLPWPVGTGGMAAMEGGERGRI